jgi:outer membrane protein OmpA-like peptidoglycan-associated protein
MKKINIALGIITAALALGACSTPPATSVIEFNYMIDNAKANGIVQVFDLSGNTVVQIRDLNPRTTHFLDVNNREIAFKVIGENVVLTGLQASFTVSTATAASRVIRKSGAPAPAPITLPTAGAVSGQLAVAQESDAALVTEIARIRKEIADLKALLASAAARSEAASAPTVADAASTGTVEPALVRVSFPNNSRQFSPAQEQRSKLLAITQSAHSISVRGYTDSEYATPGSTALAKARAESAKRYLVSMGVSDSKITVAYEGAGKFIAENHSAAGRAANRRVEIAGS